MRITSSAVLALALLLTSACHTNRVHPLQQGLLQLGLHSSEFIRYWGLPDRQYVTASDQLASASWSRHGGGSFFKGKQPIEVWVYKARKTELAFNKDRRLAGYVTELTRQELADTIGKENVDDGQSSK